MPIYVFRDEDGNEHEEIFLSWRDAPQEINVEGKVARRVPARTSFTITNPALRAAAKEGIVPVERGMRDEWRRKKAERERAREQVLDNTIAEQLSRFTDRELAAG